MDATYGMIRGDMIIICMHGYNIGFNTYMYIIWIHRCDEGSDNYVGTLLCIQLMV